MKNTKVKMLVIVFMLLISAGCTLRAPEENEPADANTSQGITETTSADDINGEKTGVWSPDSKWVAVTTVAKTWIDTVILDTVENKEYKTEIYKYITRYADKFDYKIGKNQRPDPYVNFVEWCPDSKKVLLSYCFTDDDNIRQTGVAVFNIDEMCVDWILKLPPSEGDNAEIGKPEAFSWDGTEYGIKTGYWATEGTGT